MKIRRDAEIASELERLKKQQQAKQQTEKAKSEQAAESEKSSSDTVKVGLSKAIANLSSSRNERVAELKALVESGKYTVDSRKVADALANTLEEEAYYEKLRGIQ